MGTVVQSRVLFGGPEAIDGFSAYRSGGPTPHWHWVTYGLTALYDKPEDEDPDWSGWGFELTMRAPVYPREVEASTWPMTILRGLGNHAHSTATVFQPERVIRLGGVKCSDDSPSQIVGFGFYADPELPPVMTVNGRLEFVELVGVTDAEVRAWQEQGPDAVFDAAGRGSRAVFNDPHRLSFLP